MEKILGERISGGVILGVGEVPKFARMAGYPGTHPLPSEQNMIGARAIVEVLRGMTPKDLVIFLITGGGSTLLCLPETGKCEEEAALLQALTRGGATIQEINTVRKHLSLARGGYLAKYAYPARVCSLIFSDVPGDVMEFVASGPTVKDTTVVTDAEAILEKYDVLKLCGMTRCGLIETPKEDEYFKNVVNFIAVSNSTALEAMRKQAENSGFKTIVCSTCISGDAREAGKDVMATLAKSKPKTALLYGGETTVTIKGRGRGGRNQEAALSALRFVQKGQVMITLASDGRDNGDFAGAICDTMTKERADAQNVDIKAHLNENNSTPFFEEVRNYLMTGNTGSNIADLIVAIRE